MLTSLTLKNFRKHCGLSLEFQPGLTIVGGDNWSGKSSVLGAIQFSLFGARATPWPMASLVRLGEADMEVKLGFTHAGKDYSVTRSVKSATLSREGQVIATAHSAVTAEIEKVLGCSASNYISFNVTQQGEADALLDANSKKLEGYVAAVTGVDVVDAALERLRGELQLCTGALSALPEVTFDLDQITSARVDYTKALRATVEAEAAAEAAASAQQAAAEAAAELQAAHAAATQARNQRAVAIGTQINAEQRLAESSYRRTQKPTPDLASRRVELAELAAQALLGKTQRETLAAQRAELAKADQSIQQFKGLLEGRSAIDLVPLVTRDAAASESYRALEVQVAQAAKALEESACPYCHRPFEQVDPEALQQQLFAVQTAKIAAAAEKRLAAAALADARAQNVETLGLVGSLGNWVSYRDQLVSVIDQLEADLVEPVEAGLLSELTDACSRLEQTWKAYEAGEAAYQLAQGELDRAVIALDNCAVVDGPTDAELTDGQLRAQAASEAAWEALRAFQAATCTRDAAKAALELLEAAQEAALEASSRRQHFLTREAGLTELRKYLRTNHSRYSEAVWNQLLSYASTLISEATSGSVTRLTRNAAGEFLYDEAGRELTVAGYASGMQRAIFSTAIKLSLAAAVGSPFPVMLFDEITAAAEDSVSLQFTALLASAGKQVIMVTHRTADAAAADHVIELAG